MPHPNEQLGQILLECTNKLREHFDCVSITCSVYEDEDQQTHQYVHHKGHIGGVIHDLAEHLEALRDMNGAQVPYEPEYKEEDDD